MSAPRPDRRTAILQLLGSRAVAYYPALAAIAGGVTAGVFLAQLFYWHDKGHDPDGWIYKTQDEWQEETGLTRREQETARRRLKDRGILEERLAGIPATLHYRLDVDEVMALLAEHRQTRSAESAKQDWRNPPNRNVRKRQTRLAESAKHAETTREHGREMRTQKTPAAGSLNVLCSVHGKPMEMRRKDGDTWYSHRLPGGSWCKGAPGDQPDDRVDVQSWAYRHEYATQFGIDFSRSASPARTPSPASRSGAPLSAKESVSATRVPAASCPPAAVGSEGPATPTHAGHHHAEPVMPREVRVPARHRHREPGAKRSPRPPPSSRLSETDSRQLPGPCSGSVSLGRPWRNLRELWC